MFKYATQEARLIAQGSTLRDRLKIIRMSVRLHLRARRFAHLLPQRSDSTMDLVLREGPKLRLRTNDFVLFEVFGFGAYDVDFSPLGQVRVVLDAGANIGLTTLFLATRFPEARFTCVEPSPTAFELLRENLRRNLPGATAVRAAIVEDPGAYTLLPGRHPGEVKTTPATEASDEAVEGVALGDLLDRCDLRAVDLLKLDIEGAEEGVFEMVGDWGERVRSILAEVHPPLSPGRAMALLSTAGYTALPLPEHEMFRNMIFVSH